MTNEKKQNNSIIINTKYGTFMGNWLDKSLYFEPIYKKLDATELNNIVNFMRKLDFLLPWYEIFKTEPETKNINNVEDLVKASINYDEEEEETDPDVDAETEESTNNQEIEFKTVDELRKEIKENEKNKQNQKLTNNQIEILKIIKSLHIKNNGFNVQKETILRQVQNKKLNMMSFSNDLYILTEKSYVVKIADAKDSAIKYRPTSKELK